MIRLYNQCWVFHCCTLIAGTDTQMPTIMNCPGDITATVANAAATTAVQWTPPTATDNVTPDNLITITPTHSPGDSFGFGTTTVGYTFRDQAGNEAVCTFMVTVSGKYRVSQTMLILFGS